MISIRLLEQKDAALMLEWMHDEEIQKKFQRNMRAMTLQDAIQFCNKSGCSQELINGQDLHYAIVDEADEYLGTISLKSIDLINHSAEYAIATRRKAHGKGIARIATRLILKKAFEEFELHRVYLNVLSDNEPAIRLYEKCGFRFEGESRECLLKDEKYVNLKWYGILREEYRKLDITL